MPENLYIGIDIGKSHHVAGFLSLSLLAQHIRFEQCPSLAFEQSRAGYQSLVERMQSYALLSHCTVLIEHTGHYHKALEQYLLELSIPVYIMHVQVRPAGMLKTDKRDALSLANILYNQIEKGVQVADPRALARLVSPPSDAATRLKGLVQRRYELSQDAARRKNKLIAICDELFPELTNIYPNPNTALALILREHFPTPCLVATASLEELRAAYDGRSPSLGRFVELQMLATQSIGITDPARVSTLTIEQSQLITELRLMQLHLDTLTDEISRIISMSREGQILTSIPPISPLQAASILAHMGSITNFASASKLRSYFGWAPRQAASGTTLDQVSLTPSGVREMKQVLFFVAMQAVRQDTEWRVLYQRLVPLKCHYDERTSRYKGRLKVIGRIAGQIIGVCWTLLTKDAELLANTLPDAAIPPPMLYDRAIHHTHRLGKRLV